MTDKQIIDGVDVSWCDRLNAFPMQYGEPHEICLTSLEQWGGQEKYCKDRPNCYYKQLKRKEQECEELDKEAQNLFTEKTNLDIEIKCLQQQLDQLKSTLQEIKEIAEETSQAKFRNNACIGCAFLNDKILQKISEVGND